MFIDVSLVQRLIENQFPEWKGIFIDPVATSGSDNRTFHLGKDKLVRLPSAAKYELQVEKEQLWLPKLADKLPLAIPAPLAQGKPDLGYPWKWSIYKWIEGDAASSDKISDLTGFATDLAHFLKAFHQINAADGPPPGHHNFFRGGSLSVYDHEVRRSIEILQDKIDALCITEIWELALSSSWTYPPVWVHGDISLGNLLVREGKLCAVIDFGQLAVGDPACDLVINWTLFHGKSRDAFQKVLSLDHDTWNRARGWTLWKALIVSAGLTNPNNSEAKQSWRIIDEVITDYKKGGPSSF